MVPEQTESANLTIGSTLNSLGVSYEVGVLVSGKHTIPE